MRRSGDEATANTRFSTTASSRQNHNLWLIYCVSFLLFSLSQLGPNPHTAGRNYHLAGLSHMPSAQSKRIATATVALFRQFNTSTHAALNL